MPITNVPAVAVAICVRPLGARYDLLDAAANGSYFVPRDQLGPRTGDVIVSVDPDLVSLKDMNIHVRVQGAKTITAAVYAWAASSDQLTLPLPGAPGVPVPHLQWVQIDSTKQGTDVLTIDGSFDPAPNA